MTGLLVGSGRTPPGGAATEGARSLVDGAGSAGTSAAAGIVSRKAVVGRPCSSRPTEYTTVLPLYYVRR